MRIWAPGGSVLVRDSMPRTWLITAVGSALLPSSKPLTRILTGCCEGGDSLAGTALGAHRDSVTTPVTGNNVCCWMALPDVEHLKTVEMGTEEHG